MEANILIIEDEQESAKTIEKTLTAVGYKVWVTDNPKQGLELTHNTTFAVVITELRSAKMNGPEVIKAVHEASPATNVLVLTAYSFITSAIEAMELGAYGYITKPLNTSEIRIVVERAVERFFLLRSEVKKEYYADLSVRDSLTGLYNARFLKEFLTAEFSKLILRLEKLSLMMIDIDDFKKFNDAYGHPAGDETIRKLSKVLKDAVRGEIDTIFRYGGEEFLVVLPRTDKTGAQVVAKRTITLVNLYLPVTVSIGIATYPDDTKDQDDLIKQSDAALYNAKQTGKNKYSLVK